MKTYPIPMVPGPVMVPEELLTSYQINYGSGDIEKEYFDLYAETEKQFRQILATRNQIVIQTGEGMISLWSAMKSCLKAGDRVLSISTGFFGTGIGQMAESIGAEVNIIEFPFNQTLTDWQEIEKQIVEFQPKMITVVHCETPSGTLNPLAELGRLKEKHRVPLLYADVVASAGGTPICSDDWHIDLVLGGSQKVLSAPPNMSFMSVSQKAWEIIDEVDYVGYDALKPFRTAQNEGLFPYTPYWHGLAVLNAAVQRLLNEGLENCYDRHAQVAEHCRRRLVEMGLELFYAPGAIASPTVTAVNVPDGWSFTEMDSQFRRHGLVVAGSYGPMEGKIFRIGHMGSQANINLVDQALDIIGKVVNK